VPDVAAPYPTFANVTAPERNLLWPIFTDPYGKELLPGWDVTGRRFLAEFRAESRTPQSKSSRS
jgi:hypothetical protein